MNCTDEQIEQLRKLILMMRESGVDEFTAGDVRVSFSEVLNPVIELTKDDKLAMLKDELKRVSEDEEADLMWST